jgi:hypothetical protein
MIDEPTLASFASLVEQRGGGSCFSDFQLDCALAAVEILRDIRNSGASPTERARAAKEAASLLELLPPVVRQTAPAPDLPKRKLGDVSLAEAALEYQRLINGQDATWQYDDDEPFPVPVGAQRAPDARPASPSAPPAPGATVAQAPPQAAEVSQCETEPEPPPKVVPRRPIDYDPRLRVFSIMHRPYDGGDAA